MINDIYIIYFTGSFTWDDYLQESGASPAPPSYFKQVTVNQTVGISKLLL